ncbi:MlaD family protein [Endothiovibrio diazotrophicus]
MSKRASPALIGAFVVGAAAIVVVAVVIWSGGRLFQEKPLFVMYFEGSVKGLNVGSAVTYRGVQVGMVKGIEILLTPERDARIPVTVEIDPEAFTVIGQDGAVSLKQFREGIRDGVTNDGLRAQLQMQSLLTGQLFIQLDYFPGTTARFVEKGGVAEIPTVPTTLQQLTDLLKDFPLKRVLDDVARAVAAVADLAEDPRLHTAVGSMDQAFRDVSSLANQLDQRTRPLAPALAEARDTLVEGRRTLAEGRQTLAQATRTLAAAERTFTAAGETLKPVKRLVADDSELLEEVDDTLAAVRDAAQAVQALAEALERRPESLLQGRGE